MKTDHTKNEKAFGELLEEIKKKETKLSFATMSKEQKEAFEKFVQEQNSLPGIYKDNEMTIVPDDDEEWIDPDYDHGH